MYAILEPAFQIRKLRLMVELTSDNRDLYPYKVSSYNNRLYEDKSRFPSTSFGARRSPDTFVNTRRVKNVFDKLLTACPQIRSYVDAWRTVFLYIQFPKCIFSHIYREPLRISPFLIAVPPLLPIP